MTDVPKTSVGNWDEDFASTNKTDDKEARKLPFMKFDEVGDIDIRLVGNYVTFLQHWSPPFDKPLRTHKAYKEEDPAWQAGFDPKTQCAIHVIDRRDGKLKILQKSWSFFAEFKAFKDREGQKPNDSVDSPDFTVTVEWPNGNKRQAKYKINARRQDSPLTAEERTMVTDEHVNLKELFKPYNLDYIKRVWDELPEESKIPPAPKDEKSTSSDTGTSASVPDIQESVGADDGLFEGASSTENTEAAETETATADASSDNWA